MTTTTKTRQPQGVPFAKGYDPRREGNGRKPYADLRELLEKSVTSADIVKMLQQEVSKGNVRALQEIFKVCGLYDTSVLRIENGDDHIVLRFTDAEPNTDMLNAAKERLVKKQAEADRWSFE
jgi:hypothetical protein